MARFMSFNPRVRVIALSATIPNAEELGNWLQASLIRSEWRPVPLKEEVFLAAKGDREIIERVDIGVDDLSDLVRHGVAYHNSWLHPAQRKAIEESFRSKGAGLKVICCTPTLAMGVSLPAKTVLIRNYRFFTLGRGNEPMPVCWVKQVFGRAGRPEHDKYGIGLIVARSEDEREEALVKAQMDGILDDLSEEGF